jgi:hypothetical protein
VEDTDNRGFASVPAVFVVLVALIHLREARRYFVHSLPSNEGEFDQPPTIPQSHS